MRGKRERLTNRKMISITRMLFILGAVCAVIWTSISYGIAIYSVVVLKQVYTMAELSEPALTLFFGALVAKVVENIFEHNEGVVFGKSKKESED